MFGAPSVLRLLLAVAMVGLFAGCDSSEEASNQAEEKPVAEKAGDAAAPAEVLEVTTVDAARIINADSEPGNWLSHGRTYSEQRYSPLDQINTQNVKDLGLAWYFDKSETARYRGNAIGHRRPHVYDLGLVGGLRARRQNRQGALDLRS